MSEIVLGSATQNLGARLANMLDAYQWSNMQKFLEAVNDEIESLRAQLTEAMELTNDRAAELIEANAKIKDLEDVLNYLLPNLHPANFGLDYDSALLDADYNSEFKRAVRKEMTK